MQTEKPIISSYRSVSEFVKDQIRYLKSTDNEFSVLSATQKMRRVSPALISLIIQGKRKLTLDRLEELAKVLKLSFAEKNFLHDWVIRSDPKLVEKLAKLNQDKETLRLRKKEVSLNILNDWLNIYVKDCFQLKSISENPKLIYSRLAHIADQKRIDKSLNFLLREGYLRKTLEGSIVIETELAVAETPIPSHKIRQFHKAALQIARQGIETVPMNQRYVNTLILPLNEKKYTEFVLLIQEFAEKIKDFSAGLTVEDTEALYQFNLNLIPTGRKENA